MTIRKRKKITDTDRINWLRDNLWYSNECLLDDSYFDNKNFRKAIDQVIKKERN